MLRPKECEGGGVALTLVKYAELFSPLLITSRTNAPRRFASSVSSIVTSCISIEGLSNVRWCSQLGVSPSRFRFMPNPSTPSPCPCCCKYSNVLISKTRTRIRFAFLARKLNTTESEGRNLEGLSGAKRMMVFFERAAKFSCEANSRDLIRSLRVSRKKKR